MEPAVLVNSLVVVKKLESLNKLSYINTSLIIVDIDKKSYFIEMMFNMDDSVNLELIILRFVILILIIKFSLLTFK